MTLPSRTSDGRARATALAAAAKISAKSTSLVSYRSTGALLIIGGEEEEAIAAAETLEPRLQCTVVVHEGKKSGANGARVQASKDDVLRASPLITSPSITSPSPTRE